MILPDDMNMMIPTPDINQSTFNHILYNQ